MTTKTAPKPAAPAAKASAKVAKPAAKPADQPAPKPTAPRVNPAYAAESVRKTVTRAMADLGAKGFTRPAISQHTGMTLGAVWRAQNDKVHTEEVRVIEAFVEQVLAGEVEPPRRAPVKVSAAQLQERVANATEVLRTQDQAKTVTALRKLVNDALAALDATEATGT